MLRKERDRSRGGRKPNLKVYPTMLLLGNRQEEVQLLAEIYGMSVKEAREHRKLYGFGTLYVTHHAKESCEYHVVVTSGKDVPQQMEMGAAVIQIAVKRMDGKPEPFPWSDLQEIKRAVLGDDVEAMELYPAMDRRLKTDDTWRYIWAFPNGERIPVGWDIEATAKKNLEDQNDPETGDADGEKANTTPA